jgi:hypothetical protein
VPIVIVIVSVSVSANNSQLAYDLLVKVLNALKFMADSYAGGKISLSQFSLMRWL